MNNFNEPANAQIAGATEPTQNGAENQTADAVRLYKEREARRRANEKPIELLMPSGAVWKVLPLNVMGLAVAGRLPLAALSGLQNVGKANLESIAAGIQKRLTGDDIINIFSAVRDALLDNVVSPRVTLEETEDSITPMMIDPEDFEFFAAFVLSGGKLNGFGNSKLSGTA